MENNNPLANYIVKRLENLEYEVENLKEERETLHRELAKVEEVKKVMREYFRLEKYNGGDYYIDNTYKSKSVPEIAEFIGLSFGEEDEEE
jgi:predicted nuclease with TOPRIM domain